MNQNKVRAYLNNEKLLIESSCRYFARTIFGYTINTHHDKILSHYEKNKTLDLAPRGSGKSSIGTESYVAWRALNNPDLRILIVSDTDNHAEDFLLSIKNAFQKSPEIKKHWGDIIESDTVDSIVLRGRTTYTKEPTIFASGAHGKVTSYHYDLIICDDLVTFDNSRTETPRERMKTWFKMTLLPTLLPGGEIHVLGTRYHHQDLYQMLIDDLKYDPQTQQAITIIDSEERSIWEDFLPLDDIKDAAGEVIVEGLRTKREQLGAIVFALQYQNDTDLMTKGEIIQIDWFRYYDLQTINGIDCVVPEGEEAIPITDLQIYAGVDPSLGKNETSAYFAIYTLGKHRPTNRIFTLAIERGRYSYDLRRSKVNDNFKQWHPRITNIENIAFQSDYIDSLRERYPYIRIKDTNTSTSDKVSRAWSISGIIHAGKFYVRKNMTIFITELCLMPESEFTDQLDACYLALEASGQPLGGARRSSRPKNKYAQVRNRNAAASKLSKA